MKINLPTIQDLHKELDLETLGAQTALAMLLNSNPPTNFFKKHPIIKKEVVDSNGVKIKVPIDYMPIETTEYLLTRLFVKWNVEIKSVQLIANSVVVTVRLFYQNPYDAKEMLWQDGIGASPIQTNSGTGASDFNQIKSDAVMKSAPTAKTYAIKDASHHIGRIFGKDLNRSGERNYEGLKQNLNNLTNRASQKQELTPEHEYWPQVIDKVKKDGYEATIKKLSSYIISDENRKLLQELEA